MNIDDRLMATTDRPQGQFKHFAKISNGHNSAMRQVVNQSLHVWFQGRVFMDGGSNSAIISWIESKMAAGGHLEKL